jgi:hypothetical protein
VTSATDRERRVTQIANWLNHQGSLGLANGLSCAVNPPSPRQQGMDGGMYRRLRSPTFVFDPAGTKTASGHDRGMKDFGPFDVEFFTPKRLHIAVVTPKAFQGDVESFCERSSRGAPMPRGLHRASSASTAWAIPPSTSRRSSRTRQSAIVRLAERAHRNPEAPPRLRDLQGGAQGLPRNDNSYLVAKSALMSQGVPVQGATIETIRVPSHRERSVSYALSSIALASSAKLGGIPFVMGATQSLAQELVIGIGSALLRAGCLTEPERIVGITIVFTADGNYLLHDISREVP